ncbi:unnamed protein product [Owenia fusiformis]|uniref:Uncharacterized protein n=1 Tax=Owenia fusiformis TaxID=6347 RepID=A0A8J1UEE5_OWEFU|nr:unnamed protein product [Owenia fusiformis]
MNNLIVIALFCIAASAYGRPSELLTCSDRLKLLETSKPLLGRPTPKCDESGEYAPVQCQGSQCTCVESKWGNQISEEYTMNRWETQGMKCNCARDQYAYRATGKLGLSFRCTQNGNYHPIQCIGSVCYCADENGLQGENSPTVGIWETEKLKC